MPRRSLANKEQSPAVILRRSPRFLQTELTDPETPKPILQRRTLVASPLSLTGNKKVSCRRTSCKPKSQECSQTLDESVDASRISDNSKTGLRRSARLSHCADECSAEKLLCNSNHRNREPERRVTRSSCHKDAYKNAEKTSYGGSTSTDNSCSSGEHKTEKGVNISKQCKGKLLKNRVKHTKTSGDDNHDGFDDNTNKGVLSITEKPVLDEGLSEKCVDKSDVNEMKKNVGVKRKRNQFEEIVAIAQGWTKDQELALEIAYLKAKPTPHFWKKVSRLVPGKSAQECFDKIHGNHLTPQPHPRSKPKTSNAQNQSFSVTKFLNSSTPITKQPKPRKQKTHVIQRTVRHMLQKQYKTQQDSETDLFSVLEPTLTPPIKCHLRLTTPDSNKKMCGILKRCQERSSTAHKKTLSRFNSPLVLKPVKNKVLHEKYIDLLNCREANRKGGKVDRSKGVVVQSSVERKDAIKAAKNALVFDAKDAINEFQHQQAAALIDSFNEEDEESEDLDVL